MPKFDIKSDFIISKHSLFVKLKIKFTRIRKDAGNPWHTRGDPPNPDRKDAKSHIPKRMWLFRGTPEGIRTSDLPLRRRLLYPAELLVHNTLIVTEKGLCVNPKTACAFG